MAMTEAEREQVTRIFSRCSGEGIGALVLEAYDAGEISEAFVRAFTRRVWRADHNQRLAAVTQLIANRQAEKDVVEAEPAPF